MSNNVPTIEKRSDESNRCPKHFFTMHRTQNLLLEINPTMARDVASFILDDFHDEDPPALFAFAKKLESYAKRYFSNKSANSVSSEEDSRADYFVLEDNEDNED